MKSFNALIETLSVFDNFLGKSSVLFLLAFAKAKNQICLGSLKSQIGVKLSYNKHSLQVRSLPRPIPLFTKFRVLMKINLSALKEIKKQLDQFFIRLGNANSLIVNRVFASTFDSVPFNSYVALSINKSGNVGEVFFPGHTAIV